MNIRRLIAPLVLTAIVLYSPRGFAQGAFPAPLPVQAAPMKNDPAFPPVNGAAPSGSFGAPIAATPSPFPSGGAAPVSGGGFASGGPAQGQAAGDDCMKGFLPLREEAERRGKAIKAAGERKAPPDEACKLIGAFSQSEVKMISFVRSHATKCGIPPQVDEQLRQGHKGTEGMLKKVCAVAQQQQQRGPTGPSLSEVLGSAAALPEATATKKGGSTFDTLNGNVLTR